MLHRIQRIVNVTPYTIMCEWCNGEIRAILMEDKIKEWADEPGSVYKNLLDNNIFLKVQLDAESKTLFWNGLVKMKDTTGELFNATLDIDPEVLYEMSVPVPEGSIRTNEKVSRDNKAA